MDFFQWTWKKQSWDLLIKGSLAPLLIFLLFACVQSPEQQLKSAIALQSQGAFREASVELERVMKRELGSETALQAARLRAKTLLYDLRKYDAAVETYRYLILYSQDADERIKAQLQIAQIYFDNLGWFDKALIEYGKLLGTHLLPLEKLKVKLAMARCYYYLGQYEQSLREINDYEVSFSHSSDETFDILLLRGNIFLAQKKLLQASEMFQKLLDEYPERARKENVPITMVLCLEELGHLSRAIAILEAIRETYQPKDYIDLRIRKIKQRVHNQPKTRIKK